MSALLHKLARAAGLAIDWVDADGRAQTVTDDVLRSVLGGLELPAEDDEQVLDSLEKLRRILGTGNLPPLLTVDRGQWLDLSHYFSPNALCEVELENGGRLALHLSDHGWLPALDEIGYHTLRFAGEQCVLAVAPQRCFNMSDATGSRHPRAWGIGVQLYSLRRQGDGGVGDTQALECLARSAAQQGADALGISPVHAMFSADAQRYSPYSPSSRLFNNVLYSAPGSILGERALRQAIESAGLEPEMQRLEQLDLIDWPAVAATKQRLLRAWRRGAGKPLPLRSPACVAHPRGRHLGLAPLAAGISQPAQRGGRRVRPRACRRGQLPRLLPMADRPRAGPRADRRALRRHAYRPDQ